MRSIFLKLLVIIGLTGCFEDEQDADGFKEYDGPISEVSNAEMLYSDSAIVRVRLKAQRQLNFESGDLEFPEGLYIEFYEEDGTKSSTIEANQGSYNKEKNLYTATGEVVVKNLVTGEKLETEVLNWNPGKHEIYTDRYVEIETDGEILMGEGLEANENFTSYRILKPTGSFSINNSDETF